MCLPKENVHTCTHTHTHTDPQTHTHSPLIAELHRPKKL